VDATRPSATRTPPAPRTPPGPLSAAERAERLDQAAHFRTHLQALRERVATLEKDLERLRREGGTREQINQIELQIQAARAAEPRMKGHLERIERELVGER
jgi:phage shock protein A